MRRPYLFLWIVWMSTSCGRSPTPNSNLDYVSWSPSNIARTMLPHIREPVLNLCLQGQMNQDDFERAQAWAIRSVYTWLRAVKTIDDQVTSRLAFSCDDSYLRFDLRRGSGTSMAGPGWTRIYLNRPYATWTHELGHAIAALADTYTNGRAGQCQRGQPESLMCWGAYGPRKDPEEFSNMWLDDIDGIQANYRQLFDEEEETLVPPSWVDEVDLEAPLDAENPWPEAMVGVKSRDHQVLIDPTLPTVEIDPSLGIDR